ncbi:hypothetical protein Ddye_005821 [Dipteronia dyeriana]|uniref:Uncharacterized protein n=1 Tax=Dipteronia dyeriana TaxID=168575 RepID=A0AAD9XHV6_9ROSI|nr:hypothetical protein Ddye_005821 [Dipteronia dyeriana]
MLTALEGRKNVHVVVCGVAKHLLGSEADKGTIWRIGTGVTVSVFGDRWLPRPTTFQVYTPKVHNDLILVSHLKNSTGAWNVPLISDVFFRDDTDNIYLSRLAVVPRMMPFASILRRMENIELKVAVDLGLIFAIETRLLLVTIESYSLGVVNLINTLVAVDVGSIIWDIKDHLKIMNRNKVDLMPILGNVVAYKLSKITVSVDDDCFWMESCPPSLGR